MISRSGSSRCVRLSGALFIVVLLYVLSRGLRLERPVEMPVEQPREPSKMIVMAKTNYENTSWVSEYLAEWESSIYSVDNSSAALHTKINKGHEGNAYLTYIVENYNDLRDITVFLHAQQKGPRGWHNDAPNHDNVNAMRLLKLDYVKSKGYVNLRCRTTLGCQPPLQPLQTTPSLDQEDALEPYIPDIWQSVFRDIPIPQEIGVPCCAQFAVSKEQILSRSREEYAAYLRWLVETPLSDSVSGRVFEYLWHIIFGQESMLCPDMIQCYCNVYGLCTDGTDPLENPWKPDLQALPEGFELNP